MEPITKRIVNASAWSFVGVLVTAAVFIFVEYRNPFDFRIELIHEFNLVEVKEKISDLKILYEDDDILESQKEIKVIRINLSNNGETILQSYYDQLEHFGIRFSKSKILAAEVTLTNSNDLGEKLIKEINSDNAAEFDELHFSKVIFDQGDFATVKVTLLQPLGQDLVINSIGKIANINELKITRINEEQKERTSPWIYIFGGYFGFLIFLLALMFLFEFFEKRAKKKKVDRFKKKYGEFREAEQKIVNLYMNSRRDEILISGILRNNYVLDLKEIIDMERPQSYINQLLKPISYIQKIQLRVLPNEIFHVEGTKVSFNPENEKFIKSFFGEILKI